MQETDITLDDQILQARGKPYHPSCFRCVVCRQSLEDQPFAVDSHRRIYCVSDYHRWVFYVVTIVLFKSKGGNPARQAEQEKTHTFVDFMF